jgi:hypothetical protein
MVFLENNLAMMVDTKVRMENMKVMMGNKWVKKVNN